MGNKSVTSIQYNEEDLDRALVHVRVSDEPKMSFQLDCLWTKCQNIGQSDESSCVGKSSLETRPRVETLESNATAVNANVDSPSEISLGVRRRKVTSYVNSPMATGDEVQSNGIDDLAKEIDQLGVEDDIKMLSPSTGGSNLKKENCVTDPLRWFGVLVPMALRNSQKSFRQSVELVCEVANLQARLLCIKADYRDLLLEKHRLVALCPKDDSVFDKKEIVAN